MDTKLYAILNKLVVLAEEIKDILNIISCNMTTISTHSKKVFANTLSRSNI